MKNTGVNRRQGEAEIAGAASSQDPFSSEHLLQRDRSDIHLTPQITRHDIMLGLIKIEDTLTVTDQAQPIADNLRQDIQHLRSEVTRNVVVDPAVVYSQLSRIVRGLVSLDENQAMLSEQAAEAAQEWVSRIQQISTQVAEALDTRHIDPYERSWAEWFNGQLEISSLRQALLSGDSDQILEAISQIQQCEDMNPSFFLPAAIRAAIDLPVDDPAVEELLKILNEAPRFALGVLSRYRADIDEAQKPSFDNLLFRIRPDSPHHQ
jgi:hypothetical protein